MIPSLSNADLNCTIHFTFCFIILSYGLCTVRGRCLLWDLGYAEYYWNNLNLLEKLKLLAQRRRIDWTMQIGLLQFQWLAHI